MAQAGDPKGTGEGGSELPDLKAEFTTIPYMRGIVAMAADRRPQFGQQPVLHHVLARTSRCGANIRSFGRVMSGMDAVDRIAVGEPPANPTTIVSATPRRRRCGGAGRPRSRRASAPLPARGSSAAAHRSERRLMRVDLFDFELPTDRIALRPARPRDSARLLAVEGAAISDHEVHGSAVAAAARRRAAVQRHQGHSGAARRAARRGADRRDAAQARGAAQLVVVRAQRAAAARRRPGRVRVGGRGVGGGARRGRRVPARNSMATSRSNCCSSGPGGCRCRRTSPRKRAGGRGRPRRLPDDVRARGGRGGGADRGAAFHAAVAGGAGRARDRRARR